jgi:hypothetical protein
MRLCRLSLASAFEQEPDAPFGFVNPAFEQAEACHIVEAAADGLCAPGKTFLVGHFESLCNRPAARQFDITIDAAH